MEVKKTGKIEHKVLKKQDLRELMDFLISIKEEINHERTELEFEVRFEDGTTNSGYDKSVFEDTKPITTVILSLNNYHLKKKIRIDINYFSNQYSVTSDDKDWVNAKFVGIKEIIDSVQKQNIWFSHQDRQVLLALLTGFILGSVLYILSFREIFTDPNTSNAAIAFLFALSILAGILISIPLLKHLVFNLYPEIEFDTMREHLNKNKKKRNALWAGATFVLLPFAINFISSLIF